jgi:hypothetical protein
MWRSNNIGRSRTMLAACGLANRAAPDSRTRKRHDLASFASIVPSILICLTLLAPAAHAATIHKSDDSTLTGDITAIHDGKLTITAKPKPLEIPFDDIAQIVLKEPAAPPPPPPPPKSAADTAPQQQESPTILGMLFGSHPSNGPAPATANPPQAHAAAPATTGPTSQPTAIAAGTITFTDGDIVHAKIVGWADQKIELSLTSSMIEMPANAITEMWLGTLDLQKKAKALTVEPGPEDVAFVAKDNEVVAVKGLAQGIAGSSLQFRYDNEDRKIGMQKIVGLLLRGNASSPLAGFHQRINLDNGDRLSGSLTGLEKSSIILSTTSGALPLPMASITSIDFVNGRVTSLCDIKPAKVEQTPYFSHLMPYQIDHSLTGGPLMTQDGPVTRGIAVHSRCVLTYDLSGDVDRFKTRLAFQQPQGLHGRVLARVLGDGKPLYENPDARGDQPAIDIDVPLTAVRSLTLEIDFGQDQDVGDRVVWANPRLIRGK